MTPIYIAFISIIFFYKALVYVLFKVNTYSQEKDDVREDLKKWRFSIRDALYYLAIIMAVIYPLIYDSMKISLFFLGLLPIVVSLCLYVLAVNHGDYKYAIWIDVLFIEGLGIQTNCWIINLVGFIYLLVLYLREKSTKSF